MSEDKFVLHSRKAEHVKLTIDKDVGVEGSTNGFEYFEVIPRSIPNINYSDISTETEFLGKTFNAPVLVAGMTGGYPEAEKINNGIAKICEKLNIPMGIGSQRAMIVNPETRNTFAVKDNHPELFLIGNLGLVQFCMDFGMVEYNAALEGVQADAMAIHINAFQELCQPEGDLNFADAWSKFNGLIKESKVPVIAKEVGSGMPFEEVVKMEKIGCAAVDIGGSGGTSWPKLELMRHEGGNVPFEITDPVLKWGIPTAFSTYEAVSKATLPIISTGGMYDGTLASKALMMGASMVGIARPVIKAYINHGEDGVEKWLTHYIETIKRMMFLLGIDNIAQLKTQRSRLVPRDRAREWLLHRKII
ncbi:MAG: type 2 isopentenyl-diphosphate Delta-isomerase [Candidatus Heimdallarchaeota archaeon]|nr:type 2 isopentenyl-diphosphate Delta-isomerase [Candidatus Heimdallarchaeota archaeon]